MRIEDRHMVELDIGTEFASINEADPRSVPTWVPAERHGGDVRTRVRGGTGYSLFAQNLDRVNGRTRVELGSQDFEMVLDANDRSVVRQRGGREPGVSYELWTRVEG